MAHRLLRRVPGSVTNSVRTKQPFNYLLVIDFEATCMENGQIEPQEIIEFPCVALSTKSWEVENVFHKYIKPRVHPELTPFCTELTGIMQDMVNDEPHFPEVFSNFCKWLDDGEYFENGNKSAFVTTGDWDLKVALPNQCALDSITLNEHFKQWINLKNIYSDATFYYPRSLVDMLMRLELRAKGRLHSGIDDVRNMVQIIQALHERYDPVFRITGKCNGTSNLVGKVS